MYLTNWIFFTSDIAVTINGRYLFKFIEHEAERSLSRTGRENIAQTDVDDLAVLYNYYGHNA